MIVSRRLAAALSLVPLGSAALVTRADAAVDKRQKDGRHKVAVHVNSKDPVAMTLTLNNVQNMYDYFQTKKEPLEVRIVAHGPGLHMLREDTSPVKERLISMRKANNRLSLAACANTKRNMEKDEGKPVSLMSAAEVVPSGVVELVLLEESGWTYLRP